jgi:hypothetical protein
MHHHMGTHFSDETHTPRAADLQVTSAKRVAERKTMLTNIHTHGFSCEKTKKGRLMCRLAVPRMIQPSFIVGDGFFLLHVGNTGNSS